MRAWRAVRSLVMRGPLDGNCVTTDRQILSALTGRFGALSGQGSSGLHRRFVTERPTGSCWEIRIPREPAITELFEAELSLLDSLRHQHIIAILDAGTFDTIPFYVVQHGIDLSDHVSRGGTLRPAEVVGLLQDLASALAFCHLRRVVLGSLSPLDVRCYPERCVLDGFTWAAVRSIRPNEEGLAVGNPTYFSPEFCRGDSTDARSDVYGLGAIGYLCLAGVPAHYGMSTQDILLKKMQAPPSLPLTVPPVPPELGTLVEQMLEPQPNNRPHSAQEVMETLSQIPLRA
jgi:serine/threonine protein kinase